MIERLSLPDVHALARDCLMRAGAGEDVAEAVAAEVAAAEASGERRHGMEALLRDLRLMRYGRIDPNATAHHNRARPGLLLCDAAHGFAAAALAGALPSLAGLAREQGVAILRLERASAPGAMIRITSQLADRGLSALSLASQGAGRIARPDLPTPVPLRHPKDTALALLLPTLDTEGQPQDSPLDGPVSHGASILALDAAGAGECLLSADIWDVTSAPRMAQEITMPTELLEQIVTA